MAVSLVAAAAMSLQSMGGGTASLVSARETGSGLFHLFRIPSCGDGKLDAGEQCDDGNRANGDGCTNRCRTEPTSCGPHLLGELFAARDGCNRCVCTARGTVCTVRACARTEPRRPPASSSSSGVAGVSCDGKKAEYANIVSASKACKKDEDCTLFSYSCPLITCGEGIAATTQPSVLSAAQAFAECKRASGEPIACAMCMRMTVACVGGTCVASTPKQ